MTIYFQNSCKRKSPTTYAVKSNLILCWWMWKICIRKHICDNKLQWSLFRMRRGSPGHIFRKVTPNLFYERPIFEAIGVELTTNDIRRVSLACLGTCYLQCWVDKFGIHMRLSAVQLAWCETGPEMEKTASATQLVAAALPSQPRRNPFASGSTLTHTHTHPNWQTLRVEKVNSSFPSRYGKY